MLTEECDVEGHHLNFSTYCGAPKATQLSSHIVIATAAPHLQPAEKAKQDFDFNP